MPAVGLIVIGDPLRVTDVIARVPVPPLKVSVSLLLLPELPPFAVTVSGGTAEAANAGAAVAASTTGAAQTTVRSAARRLAGAPARRGSLLDGSGMRMAGRHPASLDSA